MTIYYILIDGHTRLEAVCDKDNIVLLVKPGNAICDIFQIYRNTLGNTQPYNFSVGNNFCTAASVAALSVPCTEEVQFLPGQFAL